MAALASLEVVRGPGGRATRGRCRLVTAARAAAVVLAVFGAAGCRAPAPRFDGAALERDRTHLRVELDQAQAALDGYGQCCFERYESREYRQALARYWTLVERWTTGYLDARPGATGSMVAADLAGLAAKRQAFTPSAVRLAGKDGDAAAVVVSVEGNPAGTFFVVARNAAGRFAVAWSIRPVAEKNAPAGNELGEWAWTMPAAHTGPLGGRVSPLPPARSGRARFLIQAIAHAGLGLVVPRQIGVWEWTGSEAVPELVKDYPTTDYRLDVALAGDLLRIPTTEITRIFYSCGSCDDPEGTWTLRVTPDGVTDLGHTFKEPLLQAADDLVDRLARGQDASSLAAPAVVARLEDLIGELREDVHPRAAERDAAGPDPEEGLRGLMTWQVRTSGAHRVLDISNEAMHLLLTFEKRGGTDYAIGVEVL
jgi:hypothetical protein